MSNPNPGKKPSIQDKLNEKFDEIKSNEHVKEAVDFAKSNSRDALGFIVLFLGIITLFFSSFWGGIIIGAVGGYYFATPLIDWVRNFKEYLQKQGYVRTIILLGIALGFLIAAPAFFLGCAAAVGVKFILSNND